MTLELTERQQWVLVETQRRVPCQDPKGTIFWYEHEAAWKVYDARYHSQTAVRIAERGGFGGSELHAYLGHEPLSFIPERGSISNLNSDKEIRT